MTNDMVKVWNRAALHRGGDSPRPGDSALAALLLAHGYAMNGGVAHAAECLGSDELRAACEGYAFFGLDDIARLLVDAVHAWRRHVRRRFGGVGRSLCSAGTRRRCADGALREALRCAPGPVRALAGSVTGSSDSQRVPSRPRRAASSVTTFPARANRRASISRASCATTSNRPAAAAALNADASATSTPSPVPNGLELPATGSGLRARSAAPIPCPSPEPHVTPSKSPSPGCAFNSRWGRQLFPR